MGDVVHLRVVGELPKVPGLTPGEVVIARMLTATHSRWTFERSCRHVLRTKRYDRRMARRLKEARP